MRNIQGRVTRPRVVLTAFLMALMSVLAFAPATRAAVTCESLFKKNRYEVFDRDPADRSTNVVMKALRPNSFDPSDDQNPVYIVEDRSAEVRWIGATGIGALPARDLARFRSLRISTRPPSQYDGRSLQKLTLTFDDGRPSKASLSGTSTFLLSVDLARPTRVGFEPDGKMRFEYEVEPDPQAPAFALTTIDRVTFYVAKGALNSFSVRLHTAQYLSSTWQSVVLDPAP